MQKRSYQNDRFVSVIIIGAGSASMAAANYLLDAGVSDFIVLEKGNLLRKRHCPGEKVNSCVFCKNGCPTIEGTGGSNGNNGNKICYFPASNLVSEKGGLNHVSVIEYVDRFLAGFIDTGKIQENIDSECQKRYDSDVFNKSQFGDYINYMSDRLSSGGKLLNGVEIVDVKRLASNQFRIRDKEGNHFRCNRIVFGTGRTSYQFIRDIFDSLGVTYVNQRQDIGIRIETDKQNFSEKYYYQVDPKFKFDFDGIGSGRTFCAHNQGKVVPVRFGQAFYVDGAFGEKFTELNNIALMVRSNDYLDNNLLELWCKNVNVQFGQSYILGDVDLEHASLHDIVDHVIEKIPSFPTKEHDLLFRSLLTELLCGEYQIFKNEHRTGPLRLYGPAIDLYWPKINLTETMSIAEFSNLHVIGDAIGISRGFFQGIYSGVLWANKFVESIDFIKSRNNHEIRSSRLPVSI
jgi:uncharacterized FAD-dependent dehydrogenase